jgi:hypothetical protein
MAPILKGLEGPLAVEHWLNTEDSHALPHVNKGSVPCTYSGPRRSKACGGHRREYVKLCVHPGRATPSSSSPAATRGSISASMASSATSTPTPNRRSLMSGRRRTGRKRARSIWSGCVPPRPSCAACALSATRTAGGSPSTPTATSATSFRSSRRVSFSARPRRPSGSRPRRIYAERSRWTAGHATGGDVSR